MVRHHDTGRESDITGCVVAECGDEPGRPWLRLEAQPVIAKCDGACSSDSASAGTRKIAIGRQRGSFKESTDFGPRSECDAHHFMGVLQLPPVCRGAESSIQ
jgi:hypothetical protein